MPAPPPFPPPGSIRRKLVNQAIGLNVALYRHTGGRLANNIKGAPVLLLDHVGRKTGRARTSPLLYLRDGDDVVVVASSGGSNTTPTWWPNLKANPRTTIQIGRERQEVTARQATAEEKQRLWPRLVAMYGDYAIYQRRTTREIPVIILTPAAASEATA